MGKRLQLEGQKFGLLTVISRAGSKSGHSMWLCQCECGTQKIICGNSLKRGLTTTCGCSRQKNLIGQKFGMLTVIEKTSQRKNNSVVWKCKCDCGNEHFVSANHLINHNVTNCGCSPHYLDLLNQQIDDLFVYQKTDKRYDNHVIWKCKCACGKECEKTSFYLAKKNIFHSCGCQSRKYYGEVKIAKLLNENNYSFVQQYSFYDCLVNTRKARFDFFVDNKYIIEYDGKQHFEPVDYFGGEEGFQITKHSDKIKSEYCHSHNIPIIRIPYTHFSKMTIDDLTLETSTFIS